jgi:hypothetical protein
MSRTDQMPVVVDPPPATAGPGDGSVTDPDDGPGGRRPRAALFGLAAVLAAGAAAFAALRKRQSPSADPWAVAAEDYPDLSAPYTPPAPTRGADGATAEDADPANES